MRKRIDEISDAFKDIIGVSDDGICFIRTVISEQKDLEYIDIGNGTDFWIGNVYIHCTRPLSEILKDMDKNKKL